MNPKSEHFLKPTLMETILNKTVGILAKFGLGPSYIRVLEVQGRRTGKIYTTPVNLLELNGRQYLVGGRGHTAWSKNAQAVGVVTLKRGSRSQQYRTIPVPDADKPPVLKAYLQEYRGTVQRFFDVPADAPLDAFASIAHKHPVFEVKRNAG
jgi:deazaflavin-dependent oxidoreductase (nitroreductase family)